jgi:hypothetical protein
MVSGQGRASGSSCGGRGGDTRCRARHCCCAGRSAERIRNDYGHIDVLVNDIWGAEVLKGGSLASDAQRARWSQESVSSGQLAVDNGFTDVDGSRPDIWRHFEQNRQ